MDHAGPENRRLHLSRLRKEEKVEGMGPLFCCPVRVLTTATASSIPTRDCCCSGELELFAATMEKEDDFLRSVILFSLSSRLLLRGREGGESVVVVSPTTASAPFGESLWASIPRRKPGRRKVETETATARERQTMQDEEGKRHLFFGR